MVLSVLEALEQHGQVAVEPSEVIVLEMRYLAKEEEEALLVLRDDDLGRVLAIREDDAAAGGGLLIRNALPHHRLERVRSHR